ncbi:hypothetical protein ElyMa_003961800 [Elysia marginata]|uniref:Secreted protein n=1 Tax=Elysia marginata TaxID=1093978 RepID=A0AAV4FV98_9GAST|nr:hypothetical protein ElyMa_003961800 [Elysia marginata]
MFMLVITALIGRCEGLTYFDVVLSATQSVLRCKQGKRTSTTLSDLTLPSSLKVKAHNGSHEGTRQEGSRRFWCSSKSSCKKISKEGSSKGKESRRREESQGKGKGQSQESRTQEEISHHSMAFQFSL